MIEARADKIAVSAKRGVPPDDDEEMVSRILQLLEDPSLRKRIGTAAQLRVEEVYSPEALYRNLMSVYLRISEWDGNEWVCRRGRPPTHERERDSE